MLNWFSETDPDVLSEAALAKAQYLMSHAMRMSETTDKQLAVQMERESLGHRTHAQQRVRPDRTVAGSVPGTLRVPTHDRGGETAGTNRRQRTGRAPCSRNPGIERAQQRSIHRALEGRSSAHAGRMSSRALFGMS